MDASQEKISLWQLFALIINFEIGSAVVVSLASEAKQDAWIAVLLATVIGVLFIWGFHFLLTRAPGKNLFQILELWMGRLTAVILSAAYAIYFFYIAARILRDFGALMISVILPNTPLEAILLVLMLTIAYIIYLGIEVLGRTSEIFSPYNIAFLVMIGLFLIISGNVKSENIYPILAEGMAPVVKAIFPGLLTFPFGELVAFTVVMAHTQKLQYAGRVGSLAVVSSGLIITYCVFLRVTALGVDAESRSNFPLLSAARDISIGNFIERIDAIVVFVMMLGIVTKVSVFFFSGLKGLEYVFRIPYRSFVFQWP